MLICCIVLVALTFDVSKLEGLLMWVKENKVQGSLLFLVSVSLLALCPARCVRGRRIVRNLGGRHVVLVDYVVRVPSFTWESST